MTTLQLAFWIFAFAVLAAMLCFFVMQIIIAKREYISQRNLDKAVYAETKKCLQFLLVEWEIPHNYKITKLLKENEYLAKALTEQYSRISNLEQAQLQRSTKPEKAKRARHAKR